jgi:ABC-type oligopeptide transport system ATPase subunit
MKDTQLLVRLNEASNGHIAINGDDGPNLFRDAIKEIERLREIESLARSVFDPVPNTHDQYDRYGRQATTWDGVRNRLENGRKLGIAVGAIKADQK